MVDRTKQTINNIGFNTIVTILVGLAAIVTPTVTIVRYMSRIETTCVVLRMDVNDVQTKVGRIEASGSPLAKDLKDRIDRDELDIRDLKTEQKSLDHRVTSIERRGGS